MCPPTPSRYQKAIKKLNNIVITRLTINRRLYILSNSWKFNTFANWRILGEKFEMWLADPLPDMTFIIVGMYVINLGYLEDGPFCFTELTNSDIEELNRMLIGLHTTTIIPKTDD